MDTNLPKELNQIYSEEKVYLAVLSMAGEIQSKIEEGQSPCFIMVLKGGVWVGMAMLEYIVELNIPYGFIGLNRYFGRETTPSPLGPSVTYKPVFEDDFLRDKDVWLIDDVVQEGRTLAKASYLIQQLSPRSIHCCVLVDKREESKLSSDSLPIDIVGFKYEGKKFLVGCGMGLGEQYRNLPYICEYLEKGGIK